MTSHASGATASMSRAMSTNTGMLRSARMMPPGPTLSPIGWRMPYRCGISMSCCIESKPPTEKAVITKSAPRTARSPITFGPHRHRDVAAARDLVAELLHALHAFGVEIVQHDVDVGQRRRVREVGEQSRRPVVAAAADHRDTSAHDLDATRAAPPGRVPAGGRRRRPRPGSRRRAWRGCSRRARSPSSRR